MTQTGCMRSWWHVVSQAVPCQVWAVFPFLQVDHSCSRQMAICRLTQFPLPLAVGAGLLGDAAQGPEAVAGCQVHRWVELHSCAVRTSC